jgi:HEPN domain-containing protein
MFAATNPHIQRLLDAAERDEATLQYPVPDEIFGFHTQQAIEKLLKVLITAHGEEFEFTHDLMPLYTQLESLGELLPSISMPVKVLTAFAVQSRYDDGPELPSALRAAMLLDVVCMREFVEKRRLELEAAGTLVRNP